MTILYLSNDTEILIFGWRLRKELGITFTKIELREDQSNVADGQRVNVTVTITVFSILKVFCK